MTAWLNAAARTPLLTPVQELQLSRQVRAWLDDPAPARLTARRGLRARNRMVQSNLRLVAHCEPRVIRGGEQLDRLQAGSLGLIRAAEKFDPTRGYRFSTYAIWWIRKGISQIALRDPSPSGINLPLTWEFSDPRRVPFRRVLHLDAPPPLDRDRGETWAEVIPDCRETVDIDQLAVEETLHEAWAALEDPSLRDDLALLELRAEGATPTEIRLLTGAKSAAAELQRARDRLADIPAVAIALAA